ncbi:ORF6N domain-containing protein [Pseudomonas sp. C9-3]|uniref:ORF6N domain-containing protein n=1 Tax=Pseudomonas sp. C9-3 TaxID=3078264 RepID=UPI0028F1012F|nr:ORF6N domain-containing protein [Pseudomonas sp. C9-3]
MNSPMRQIITIANSDLTVIEHRGERVVTLAMIDEVHQRPTGTARRNFNTNRDRFIEGKHLYKICADEFRTHKPGIISSKSHEDVILLTQRGYLLLVKSFTDELSWQVQDMLVDGYFERQEQPATPATHYVTQSRHRLALAKELANTRDPGLREVIYQQLAIVSQAMGLPTPGQDTLGAATPPPPDNLIDFWKALAYLKGKGVDFNHSLRPRRLLAVNVPHLEELFAEHGIEFTFDVSIHDAWRACETPPFVGNKPVKSKLESKIVKCWVFDITAKEF